MGGILGTSWEGPTGGPKKVPILGLVLGSVLGQKMVTKMAQKLIKKRFKHMLFFGTHFLEVLELLRCLLGAFWGFLGVSWEASGLQKP